jgi:hypothetical protein
MEGDLLKHHRWKDIEMNLQEIDCEGVDRINLAQDWDKWQDFVNALQHLRIPLNVGKCLTS